MPFIGRRHIASISFRAGCGSCGSCEKVVGKALIHKKFVFFLYYSLLISIKGGMAMLSPSVDMFDSILMADDR